MNARHIALVGLLGVVVIGWVGNQTVTVEAWRWLRHNKPVWMTITGVVVLILVITSIWPHGK